MVKHEYTFPEKKRGFYEYLRISGSIGMLLKKLGLGSVECGGVDFCIKHGELYFDIPVHEWNFEDVADDLSRLLDEHNINQFYPDMDDKN